MGHKRNSTPLDNFDGLDSVSRSVRQYNRIVRINSPSKYSHVGVIAPQVAGDERDNGILVTDGLCDGSVNENLLILSRSTQSRGQIHDVADRRVIMPALVANLPYRGPTQCEANTKSDGLTVRTPL
jgi:hypothetical protein